MAENNEPIKLNLGCGLNAPPGWINIDASFTARLSKWDVLYKFLCRLSSIKPVPWPKNIKVMDVRKKLPFLDESIQAIFTSHMLEHLTYEDAKFVAKECHRCLRDGGVIRIIVPDLFSIARRYVESTTNSSNGEYSHIFLKDIGLLDVSKGLRRILGRSRHLYMYDEYSLRELLEKTGFKSIERVKYGKSRIEGVGLIEDEGRHEMSICLEGLKR